MADEIESFSGRWWFHGREKPALSGILETANGSIRLKLDVPKDPVNPSAAGDLLIIGPSAKWPSVIHGRDRDDQPLTLFGCSPPSWTQSAGMITYEVSALAGIREQEVESWDQPFFRTAIVKLEYLSRWLNQPYVQRLDTAGSKKALCASESFEDEYELEEGVRVAFEQNTHHRSSWDEESFRPSAQIAFYFSSSRSIQEITRKWVPWAQRLIGLLIGTGIGREKVLFFKHDASQAGISLDQWLGSSAELIGQRIRPKKTLMSDPHTHNMLAPYPTIKTSMPTIMREWHRLNRQMEPVLNLFTAVALHHNLYQSAQFLFLVQALEVYYALSDKFEAQKKSWAKRLQELFEAHRDVAEALFGNINDTSERIANTRNELTHGKNKKPPGLLLNDQEISLIAWSMETFLWILLLRELGIDGESVQRLVRRVKETKFVSLA